MTLDELRSAQHEDETYQADAALTAYLAEVSFDEVRLDRAPVTSVEIRHLAHAGVGA